MADEPIGQNQVAIRLTDGQTNIGQQCSYYESDGVTAMTYTYSGNRVILTPSAATVTADTIYIEYSNVRYIWGGWSLQTTYDVNINNLQTDISIDRIELPNGSTLKIHDARIAGIDTTPTSGSDNPITSGGVYDVLGDIATILASI